MKILTFDIEEWFHIEMNPKFNVESKWNSYERRLDQNMDLVFELLEKHDQKATFFCLGWIAREYPHIIKRIDELGHEIGSHSDMHKIAYTLNRKEYSDDLERSIASLEEIIGKKIISYRAPAFSIKSENSWALDQLIEQGIKIDSSIFPAKRDFGGFDEFSTDEPCIIESANGELMEFPMNTHSLFGQRFVFSGGGYFRFFPKWSLKKMMNSSEYVMGYFHPRDFDPDIPVIEELSIMRKFKSYYGLKSTYEKLDYFLENENFIDLGTAVKMIDWSKSQRISIS